MMHLYMSCAIAGVNGSLANSNYKDHIEKSFLVPRPIPSTDRKKKGVKYTRTDYVTYYVSVNRNLSKLRNLQRVAQE